MSATRAWPAIAAGFLFVAALIGFGLASPDFGHLRHPVALLGASGEPNALAFNLTAFVLPGLLLAWQAFDLRRTSNAASWKRRVGLQLAMLSALAFAAQGLLPLDPTDLLAQPSRLHALAWTLWWVAFVPGALLIAWSGRAGRIYGIVIALLLPLCALFGALLMPAPVAQRLAFLLWFAWWVLVALRDGRGEVSAQGASPPSRR